VDGDLSGEPPTQIKSVTDFFIQEEPFYLSIGMTHREYWDGAPELARYSLKAFNLKRKREFEDKNYLCWLQGMYNFRAVFAGVSYAINGKEAERCGVNYPEEPFDFTETSKEEATQSERKKALEWMAGLHKMINRKFGGEKRAEKADR